MKYRNLFLEKNMRNFWMLVLKSSVFQNIRKTFLVKHKKFFQSGFFCFIFYFAFNQQSSGSMRWTYFWRNITKFFESIFMFSGFWKFTTRGYHYQCVYQGISRKYQCISRKFCERTKWIIPNYLNPLLPDVY